MKRYIAYTRVSTVKQGEKGSSLQEQRAAIESYARRYELLIAEWFEEKETAAKQGRPIFVRMLKALERGQAAGVITHKIDRSARNLRDWAALGELHDRGVELHFAHESIDLSSRGGRLSADIQAVVAADYVRNLREEVRKGFYGRLKQGFYPLPAPVGYLDGGGGVVKEVDPISGPLVAKAFALYASGSWSLDSISAEMFRRGLRAKRGGQVGRNGFSTIFNNPFYLGLIRIAKTGELFQGRHKPLVDKRLFDRVQAILTGRTTHKANLYRFRYQRLLHCCVCRRALTATRTKGHVYYRCYTRTCPTTCVREELIDEALRVAAPELKLSERQWAAAQADLEAALVHLKSNRMQEAQNLTLSLAAIDDRLARLTDAYVDQIVDRDTYLSRKEKLLEDRAAFSSQKAALEAGGEDFARHLDRIFELAKALSCLPKLANDEELREVLKDTTSNLAVCGKKLVITWSNPFRELVSDDVVTSGGPHRDELRTGVVRLKNVLMEHLERFACYKLPPHANDNEPPGLKKAA